MRTLLTLLAFIAVVMAVLLDSTWMYVIAGAFLVAAIGGWARSRWREYQRSQRRRADQSTSPDDELRSLGIMEVREKQRANVPPRPSPEKAEKPDAPAEPQRPPEKEEAAEAPGAASSRTEDTSRAERAPEHAPQDEEDNQPASASRVEPSKLSDKNQQPAPPTEGRSPQQQSIQNGKQPHLQTAEEEKVVTPEKEPDSPGDELQQVLSPYLRSLRAATDAHTACLLVQDEVALTYRVEGMSSESGDVASVGTSFSTQAPLLTASLSRQAAALRIVDHDLEPEALGYYTGGTPNIAQVGLAPVSRPDHPSTFFLLVDSTHFFDEQHTQRLLARYADLLAFLLNAHDAIEAERARQTDAPADAEHRDGLPPRRTIIAREMERARAEGHEMALALLYLNRAESIASKGEKAVSQAERALQTWLERSAEDSRVEPFGELTYGIFFNGSVQEAESWAVSLQREFENAPSPLEGGVSIGLSMLRPRHQSPDALRDDATEALREAYTTGTCTILE